MSTMRTLKLALLADVSKFGAGLNKASADTNRFSNRITKYAKQAATAFVALGAAVGYAAVKMGVDAVKAAAEDELSQKKLAKALQNTTNATDKQIAANEKWIGSQQLALGISDTKIRPALANLARATGSVTKAQELTNLAMDIAAARSLDLETVSLALAKAQGGNLGALKKLGVPLSDNIVKTKDLAAATQVMTDTYGGSAQANTETYAGKMAILSESIGEVKEQIGTALMPYFMRFTDWASKTLVPTLQMVADGFSGKPYSVSNKLQQVGKDLGFSPNKGAYNLGAALQDLVTAFSNLFTTVTSGEGAEAGDKLQQIADSLEAIAQGMDSVSKKWDKFIKVKNFLFGDPEEWAQMEQNLLNESQRKRQGKAVGGMVRPGQAYRVGEFGAETFIPTTGGRIVPKGAGGGGNTFIFNGVVDGESARRSIENLMRQSARRTGAINLVGHNV